MILRPTRSIVMVMTAALFASTAAFAAPSPEWIAKVRQLIAAQQKYPRAAQIRGDEGTAKLRLDVAADGSIAGVELVQPTGSNSLDREAVAIPKKVGTFPPPPGGPTSIVVPLTWKQM
jgi:periplasmic protein TonB